MSEYHECRTTVTGGNKFTFTCTSFGCGFFVTYDADKKEVTGHLGMAGVLHRSAVHDWRLDVFDEFVRSIDEH